MRTVTTADRRSILVPTIAACVSLAGGFTARGDEASDLFERRIRPLLVERCLACHGPDEAGGNLRLDSRAGWERGGDRGPAIVPGDPTSSPLVAALRHADPDLQMPPADSGPPLEAGLVDDVVRWVRIGAFDPRTGDAPAPARLVDARGHWSFRPVTAPALEPGVHPIDALVERRLREQGFVPTPPADMPTLVRRVVYDLHGLPPTPEQLATPREEFPRLVQELLASPRYGERWGRHWLDVARYSDAKDGVLMYGDARIRPFAYTYRDYVIRAFNEDKPFDRFVREQLAADRLGLSPDSPDLAALGLLTLGRMFDRNRHDVIDDQIDVVTRGFLGLTVACARCHDHKSDPVPTADYYSLYGVFASTLEPYDRPRIAPLTEAGAGFETEFAAKLAEVIAQQRTHHDEQLTIARDRTADYLVHIVTTQPDVAETAIFFLSLTPEQLRPQVTRRWRQFLARRVFADDQVFGPWHDLARDPTLAIERWRRQGVDERVLGKLAAVRPTTLPDVARAYGELIRDTWSAARGQPDSILAADPLTAPLVARDGPIWFPEEEVANYLSRQPGDAYRGLVGQLDAIAVRHAAAADRAMVVVDAAVPCEPVVFQRGDPRLRGAPVPRRFLEALSAGPRQPFGDGGGRLDLAEAIVAPGNPLTARVWVNRIWMHHFGEPLVESPGDFGLQTKPPVHLDLLDYLAAELVQGGWRTKPIHELIVSSQTWQRSSLVDSTPDLVRQQAADPANTLFWKAPRRRLDFEQFRDALLAVSGELDLTMGGRPAVLTDPANRRRTVYGFVERQNIPPMVQTFDVASADTSTPRRTTTTVPQQALFAMNDPFVLDRAAALAERVRAAGAGDETVVLFRLALGRDPTAAEAAAVAEFRGTAPLEQACHALLMGNEFMFVD